MLNPWANFGKPRTPSGAKTTTLDSPTAKPKVKPRRSQALLRILASRSLDCDGRAARPDPALRRHQPT